MVKEYPKNYDICGFLFNERTKREFDTHWLNVHYEESWKDSHKKYPEYYEKLKIREELTKSQEKILSRVDNESSLKLHPFTFRNLKTPAR